MTSNRKRKTKDMTTNTLTYKDMPGIDRESEIIPVFGAGEAREVINL